MHESTAFDWIELTGNELEACRSIERAKSMLFDRRSGETIGEIDSTSPPGHNVTSQMREPALLDPQHATDLVALLDGPLGKANFLFQSRAQVLNNLVHSRPVAPPGFWPGQLRPGVRKLARNGLRRDVKLRVQRNLLGILQMNLPQTQSRRIPDTWRGTPLPPARSSQRISMLNPVRQTINQFLSRQQLT